MKFSEEQIQASDALLEMSQGHWEGCHRSDVYTSEVLSLVDRFQPDFSAPSGESLRQVEFRMVQFLNGTVVGRPEKLRSDFSPCHTNSSHDRDGPSLPPQHWELLNKPRQGFRKKSGKSRLQIVTTGDHEADDEMSPREPPSHQVAVQGVNVRSSSSSSCSASSIGVFTHSIPIKCLLTGLLGCSTMMSNKMCIDDSSVTVIQHSWKTGWQIKRMNDTAHLRLL